ncbi:MAG TPA: efflux RND transporter permease subunit [Candidatus Angelobacter sp.]|nr:efflux RND transporter permease subunit [Candidatus Angelobacter sp.]
MNLPQAALRRPLTIVVMVIAIALASTLAWLQMPKDIFPEFNLPTIYVAQAYGGMDPAQMEGYLVYFFEYHFLYLTGIEHVESKSIEGAALMKLQFHPGTDMSQAMAETVAYVNRARSFMPPGTVPPLITRFDAGSVPTGYLVFSSDTRSITEMQDAALNRVRPLLSTLSGVSAPPPFGGNARTIVVNLKPDRLKSYHMSPDEVAQAIAEANVVSPSGNIMKAGQYPLVPVNSVPHTIDDLRGAPIRGGEYPAVFVRDVADVLDDSDIVTCYALVNGKRAIYVPVTKRADASTLAVAREVRESISKFQGVLPQGMKVSFEMDRSPVVTSALAELPWEACIGALLTGLMVILFLRDWRSALVVVVNIPIALMSGVLALWLGGQTINLMTLGGLALAVGILVDTTTVCLENIHVHRARGQSVAHAALDATTETAGPRLLAMLCILVMFTPALLMTGAPRAMFMPLSLAVGFAMVASYFLSSTLVPVLMVWMSRVNEGAVSGSRWGLWQDRYGAALLKLERRHGVLILAYLCVAIAVIAGIGRLLGTEMFPRVESNELQLRLRAAPGTSIDGTEAALLKALDVVKATVGPDNVRLSLGFVGLHGSSYPINYLYLWDGGTEEGVLQIQLADSAAKHSEDLKKKLRQQFAAQIPDVSFSFEPADLISRVTSMGVSTPIEVAVSGPNIAADRAFADKIKAKLEAIPTLQDVQYSQSLDYPTVKVTVDRERAGIIGPTMAKVSRALVPATWSSRFEIPNYWADPNTGIAYQVQTQIPQNLTTSLEDVGNLPVMEAGMKSILLRNLGHISQDTQMSQYDRYNMQRTLTVRANIVNEDLGSTARRVAKAVAELGAPPARVSVTMRGQVAPMAEMLDGLQQGLMIAIGAIFLLLAANFQSLKLSLIVMSTAPATLAGVALSLWLTHTTINLDSFMGAIMALGVAVANAILLVTFAERARMSGATAAEAAKEGARSRLRPILMTSLAMIAGMLPVAIGLGDADRQMVPLGRAVVGGLGASTIATLFVLPAIFARVQKNSHRRGVSVAP